MDSSGTTDETDTSHSNASDRGPSIKEETRDQIQVGETSFGRVAYHGGYRNESVLKFSEDPHEILALHEKGWDVSPGQTRWILRAPEVALCDLSNPLRNPTQDPHEILHLYEYIQKPAAQGLLGEAIPTDLAVHRLEGKSLETIEKVAGSDHRVTEVPRSLYERLKGEGDALPDSDHTPREWDLWETTVDNLSSSTHRKWEEVSHFYEQITNVAISKSALGGFWEQLPQADINVFVPKAGITYFLGYLEETGNDNAVLWEYHRGINPTKEVKFHNDSFEDKRVNIIDKAYTGGTVKEVGEQVRNEGGSPRLISVFPKSAEAVAISDHVVFCDSIEPADSIDTSARGWYRDLFERLTSSSA